MSEELKREVRKLEARINSYIEVESDLINALKKLKENIEKIDEICNILTRSSKGDFSINDLIRILELRVEFTKIINEVLEEIGRSDHAKSHFIESFNTLFMLLEENVYSLATRLLKGGHS